MPYSRPTLTELRQSTAADIAAALPGADALLRYSNIGILGLALAALTNGLYGYLDWIAKQAVPFTATDEYLEAWAALKGIVRLPAAQASGTATFGATNGTTVPVDTPVQRSDGVAYVTTAAATAAGGSVTVPVTAVAGGSAGNASAGIGMMLAIGIAGVSGSGTGSVLSGGGEIESDDDLRNRMLDAYAAPAEGGATSDYERWALTVPGVTRAWARANAMGPGTVVVLFMLDSTRAAQGGFPQGATGAATGETRADPATGDQLLVANAIYPKQPATALVYAASPVVNSVTMTIQGISGTNATTRAAIAAAVSKLFRTAGPGDTARLSAIEAAIAAVAGTAGFIITGMTASAGAISPAGVGNIVSSTGAIPLLAGITYA